MLGVEVFRPLRELSRLYHRGMIAMSAAKGIFALMDTPPAVQEPSESTVSRLAVQSLTPVIEFETVSFGYPTRPRS